MNLTPERAGFEPAIRLSADTRFPVVLLRPLGHLSILLVSTGNAKGESLLSTFIVFCIVLIGF